MTDLSFEKNLTQQLSKAGAALDVDAALSLIAGVAAAPVQEDDGAWMHLVTPNPPSELKDVLEGCLSLFRARQKSKAKKLGASERLDNLRQELTRLQVDGFVVPRGDEHQGEYVALKSERLHWLTGFSGSAGTAVVLMDKAAVFVDGRYTLQAENEVDTNLFDVCHLVEMSPTDWIAKNLPGEAKLAFDPWLHTPGQVSRLETACMKAGAELIALDENPIDCAWSDQPPPPISPVVSHEDTFSGQPSLAKCQQLSSEFTSDQIDALILSAPDSIAWLLNIRGADIPFTPFALSFAILHSDASIDWFIDPRKLNPGLSDRLGADVRIHTPDHLAEMLGELGKDKQTVLLNTAMVPMWIYQRLKDGGATIKRGDDPCQLAKACKNAVEMEGMRNAHRRDGASVCRFLKWIASESPSENLTEMNAGNYLASLRRENNYFQGLSFSTISGSGSNGAIVHYRVTEESNKVIESDTLFLLDSGAQYLDGTTDITRTIAIGTPSQDMQDNFSRVLKGHIALARVRFPKGTSGSQLDVLARLPLWQAGLDYDHGTGHGVGSYLSVHEGPQRISKMPNSVALKPGMIISNEPGFYKTGAYGIRIENLVGVVPCDPVEGEEKEMLQFETLTLAPIDRKLINTDLMNDEEIAWLDAYHLRVRNIISPLLDDETARWLESATAPLP